MVLHFHRSYVLGSGALAEGGDKATYLYLNGRSAAIRHRSMRFCPPQVLAESELTLERLVREMLNGMFCNISLFKT